MRDKSHNPFRPRGEAKHKFYKPTQAKVKKQSLQATPSSVAARDIARKPTDPE